MPSSANKSTRTRRTAKQAWREADALVERHLKRSATGLPEEALEDPLRSEVQGSLKQTFLNTYKFELPEASADPASVRRGCYAYSGDGRWAGLFGVWLDLKDYFHTLRIDKDLSFFLGLMPIHGRDLPDELRRSLGLSLDDVRFPCRSEGPRVFGG